MNGLPLRFVPIAAALCLLTGCSIVGTLIPSDETTDGPLVPVAGDTVDAAMLTIGDCLNAVDGDLLSGLDAVPCSDEHDWEVYAEFAVAPGAGDAGGFPGADAVVAAAEEGCGAQFWLFLGLPTDTASALGYTYLAPDESDAPGPDGYLVHCLIGDMGGPVTGTLAGAAR
ncbi:septum formation family protein [Cryobacterium sp. SO2]|uniref:septum formation family protein n=1 Tax=Cryobacterium sp. SO2 TaxID=1897060 RepID=UPI00223DE8A2|nr:septum formation family protein [Cryobacterium sp. SO2]WEO76161.1 septum formation family protein [Cryobacterium sp. SO2]